MNLHKYFEYLLKELSTSPLWESIYSFLTSSLGEVIIGTLVASFAGVAGAHILTEKFNRRDIKLKELRATNAAIMTVFEISNSMLSLKNQHVKELWESYKTDKEAFELFNNKRLESKNVESEIFYFNTNFITINPMLFPGDILLKLVYEDISPPPRAYVLAGTLIRSIDSLNQSITSRNELIQFWKTQPQPRNPDEEAARQSRLVPFYFGLANPAGHIDTSYPDVIEAISSLTDDCIQFSYLLGNDLLEHGKSIRTKLGRKSPKINTPDFKRAVEQGLMPDPSKYEDWETMFKKHPSKSWLCSVIHLFKFRK